MRTFLAIAALIALANTHVLLAPTAVAVPETPNGNCIPLVLTLVVEIPEFIQDVKSGDAAKAEQLFGEIVNSMQALIKCIQGKDAVETFSNIAALVPGDRKDCIYRYVRLAIKDMKQSFEDLENKDFDAFKADVEAAVNSIKNAIEKC